MLFAFLFLYNIKDLGRVFLNWPSITLLSIGFGFVGFVISASLIFYLRGAFQDQPLWISLILKMLYSLVLFTVVTCILLVVYAIVYTTFIYKDTFRLLAKDFFTEILITKAFRIFLLDLGIMTFLTILLLEVTDKYGPGMFWSMLRGQYHKPKKENRIFIFLDINASSSIAEKLGHTRYFSMLRDFFGDITIPVLANDGNIYQYVGDEVVLSWLNTLENKAKCLKFIRNVFFLIKRREKKYLQRYGLVPEFKAGIHAGEVTAGFIGIIKKDLVYSGETLNAAARIRTSASEVDHSFVVSEDFLGGFEMPQTYKIEEIGKMELKGLSEPKKLFSLTFE